jgi:hypothetical protein
MRCNEWTIVSLISLSASLAGCSPDDSFSFNPEDKINAAVPVSQMVIASKAALLDQVTDRQRKEIETEYSSRLKLRALTCAKGYSPSWYVSKNEVKKNLSNVSCFTNTDAETERWLGMRRIGLLASKPALRPIPAQAPAFIIGDTYIQSIAFADNAGVALLGTQKSLQIVDIETNKPIFEEPKTTSQVGQLSANARLYSSGSDGRTRVRDSETGAALLELSSVHVHQFQWLDNSAAMYRKADTGKLFIIDFASGKEVEVQGLQSGATRLARVPGADNQYVLGNQRSVAKIELLRTGQEPAVKLVQEKPITNGSWSSNTSGATADGVRFFGVNPYSGLTLLSLETLDAETIVFDPFRVQTAITTPDPNQLILAGYTGGGQGVGHYLYSINERTMTKLDKTKLLSDRFVYIPSLKKHAVIADSKVAILGSLPLEQPVALDKFLSAAMDEANQRKLEAAQKLEEMQQQAAAYGIAARGFPTPSASATPAAPVAYSAPSPSAYPAPTGPIAALAKSAQMEAVGVYQGANGQARGGDRTGDVQVRVRRSARPIVLILSSYERVRWNLVMEPGAQLSAVLVSGYYPSQVIGAGSARVVTSGSTYAYKNGSSEYAALERDVLRLTGKRIDIFQGRYEGISFSVGG